MRANATPRPTMRDVAERAGVSLKTVSRVINGEDGVAAPTAERVGTAIAELGFERNDLAASLRHGQSSGTLGLVIEDVANPFYSAVAQAVETAARDRGLLLITASAREDPERERELVTALMRRRVDALLMVPAGPDHRYVFGRGHVPAVFLDRPPGAIDADSVLADDAGGARRGVEHLLAQGHTRIACVADAADLYTARERLRGYHEALAAAGMHADPALVRTGNRSAAEGQAAVERLLALPDGERPSAILAANNRNTVGAVRAIVAHDHQPALVGFDDFELADVLGVTVMRSDPALMGERAAELAFARLDGDNGPPQQITVPTTLVIRGSGEVAR